MREQITEINDRLERILELIKDGKPIHLGVIHLVEHEVIIIQDLVHGLLEDSEVVE